MSKTSRFPLGVSNLSQTRPIKINALRAILFPINLAMTEHRRLVLSLVGLLGRVGVLGCLSRCRTSHSCEQILIPHLFFLLVPNVTFTLLDIANTLSDAYL